MIVFFPGWLLPLMVVDFFWFHSPLRQYFCCFQLRFPRQQGPSLKRSILTEKNLQIFSEDDSEDDPIEKGEKNDRLFPRKFTHMP